MTTELMKEMYSCPPNFHLSELSEKFTWGMKPKFHLAKNHPI